jgi:RNA polymerase sigma factor (sigma-70 family)
MRNFNHELLSRLTDQQVRFAPPARRQEQILRADKLVGEIDPAKQYPYAFVCYRVTDYRLDPTTEHAMTLIPGSELRADLFRFMDELARSLPVVPIEQAGEPMVTLAQLSERLNVSTKTISRWREQGLVGRLVMCNGRAQLGFAEAFIEQFVSRHAQQVERGAKFAHLTADEKATIVHRAKRLANAGGSLTEVSRRIAKRLQRSIETVRYTIKRFDAAHPNQAIYPTVRGPLDGATKQLIFTSFRKGITVETLATRYGRTRTSMYRVINEVKAERLLAQPLDYIYNAEFDDPNQTAVIMGPMPDAEKFAAQRKSMKAPKDVPPELASLYEWPLLTREQEQHVFRKLNYLKHQLHQVREQLRGDVGRAKASDFARVDELLAQIAQVKDILINCNMRLVTNIAKRHSSQNDNFFELLSDGNMSLIRAVEKFDYSRGNKFSTYASWAIMKNFARSIPDERHHQERYVTGHEDLFDAATDNRSDEQEAVATAEQAKTRVNRLLDQLDPRDREIIRLRMGMDDGEGLTLEQIGQRLGITKERVRQLNVRAMKKLRDMATEQKMDLN